MKPPATSPLAATVQTLRRRDRPHLQGGKEEAAETAIMAATERLLETKSLHDLSVAEIVSEAHISRGTFYFWFSSKNAVVIALVADAMQEMHDAGLTVMTPDGRPPHPDAITDGVRAAADVWARHRAVLRAAVQQWHTSPDLKTVMFELVNLLSDALGEVIAEGRRSGHMIAGPPPRELAASLIWSSQYCLYLANLDTSDQAAHDQAAATLAWLWSRALFDPRER